MEPAGDVTEIALAEFAALRNEIQARTVIQAGLLAVNVTSVGTVAGFYLNSHPPRPGLLLIIHFVSSVLGLAWIDHARTITSIGMCIGRNLWPCLRQANTSDLLPCREDNVRVSEKKLRNMLLVIGPPCATFVIPAVLALVVFAWSVTDVVTTVLWLTALVITLGNATLFLMWMKSPNLARLLYDEGALLTMSNRRG